MNDLTLLLGTETTHLKRSVIRDLLKLAFDPEIISLAGGLPASELLPTNEFRKCVEAVLRRDGSRALQYSPQHLPLREWIAGYMQARGVCCEPDHVVITNGAQQGLAILSRLLLDPGQLAVIEAVTFTGIQQVTAGRGARLRTIPTDLATGADIDALEEAFREVPRPRLAILIPDFHNPMGVSLTLEKRVRAAALAAEFGVPLIEDDPYSALRFSGEALPPIKAFDEADLIFHVGSFSKMIAPALRLGWIIAPANLLPKLMAVRESIDLESSTLIQRAVAEFLARGLLEPHLDRLNAANYDRSNALLASLREQLGHMATWSQPEGGLFTWVTLPANVDTDAIFPDAVERKVAYVPGSAFSVHAGHSNTMRLNFSNTSPEAIRKAIDRLAVVIRTYSQENV